MIIITGAAGFIGSAVAAQLIEAGRDDLWLVDDWSKTTKMANYQTKAVRGMIERARLFAWLEAYPDSIDAIIHLGARTDTAEFDVSIFDRLNLAYSQALWRICQARELPFLYASSAATYGDGSLGFDDDQSLIPSLKPLNPYGQSKQDFDLWVLEQSEAPPVWAGLKFFNVFGPNEYHKGRMASVVYHAYQQILRSGEMKLFRSHREEWADGQQRRDFIYVKDLTKVISFWLTRGLPNDIYNLGTGSSRTFLDLTKATFAAMDLPPRISYIDIPPDIRERYQYFTEAKMGKLRQAGYSAPFTTLEAAIDDYVGNYLRKAAIW
ncbi:MAG: ADP-glyceromanno-heptose 6-epimerase [Bacteroidota bacterium]